MPLFYQHTVNQNTKLAIWRIEEPEKFFLQKVPSPSSITNPHKRLQHLAGRWLLQFLFPEFPYDEIVIADTKKPYLPDEQYHFSISHCANYAAAIASKDKRVGIDVEVPTEKVEKIKYKFLNEEELSGVRYQLSAMSDGQLSTSNPKLQTSNLKLLTLLWCAKEAVFKWWSYGGVDFREHICLTTFDGSESGFINACFDKTGNSIDLKLRYKLFEELALVWVVK